MSFVFRCASDSFLYWKILLAPNEAALTSWLDNTVAFRWKALAFANVGY